MTSWRPDAPAATKRYKNRKKTLRRSHQMGWITADERAELLVEARLACLRERQGGVTDRAPTAWDVGLEWLVVHGEGALRVPVDPTMSAAGSCSPLCIGAEGHICRCPCKGLNHGAVHWADRREAGLCRCGRPLTTEVAQASGECAECAQRRWDWINETVGDIRD